MGRPLIEALEALDDDGEELDLSCFLSVSSSAAVFSPTVKDEFLERFPNLVITDSIEASDLVKACKKVRQVTVAPLIGEAIRRIANEESVSKLFD